MSSNLKDKLSLLSIIIIMMIPAVLLIFVGKDSIVVSSTKKIAFFLFSLAYLLFPLFFLKPKIYALLSIFLDGFLILEIYHILSFKAPPTENMLATIFYTNYNESLEFIKSNFGYLLLILLIIFFQLFLVFNIKKSFVLSRKSRLILLLFSLSVFSVIFIRDYIYVLKNNKIYNFKEKILSANALYEHKLNKVFPVEYFFKINNVYHSLKKWDNYKKKVENYKFGSYKKDTVDITEIYVLVIGETARRHNFHIFGYHRNTTPNLSNNNQVIAFSNVLSAANLTYLSIPFIVTRATPDHTFRSNVEPSIVKAFEEAGFKTYWLSNQPGVSNVQNLYGKISNVYINTAISLDVPRFDEILFDEFDKALSDKSNHKKFIVLHTQGSHFRYNFRYPDSFEKFKPTISKNLSLTANDISYKENFVNSYDNSILYTDYILSTVIKKLQDTNSSSYMYYISDHGENLYDDENGYLMHGLENPSKYELEIPLIFWYSKKYQSIYPDKIKILKENKDKRISMTNTFQTLLDLSNVGYRHEDLKLSFASEKFDSLQNRYFLRTNNKVLRLD